MKGRRGLYQGYYFGVLNWALLYNTNFMLISALQCSFPSFVTVPLTSLLVSVLYYPVDTALRRIQIQGFLGNKNKFMTPGAVIEQMKSQKTGLYNGVQFFVAKTILLGSLQWQLIQAMNGEEK